MERTELLARLQEIREQPASKAETTHRAELVGRMRRIAGLCKAEHEDEAAGAVALLHEIDPTSSDHIALAIAAHKLLVKVVVRDLTGGGQTEPEYPHILSLLSTVSRRLWFHVLRWGIPGPVGLRAYQSEARPMSATTWRGDDGDTPRRTGRVLRWYRLRLKSWFRKLGEKGQELEAKGQKTDPIVYPTLLDGLTDWYAERPQEFLRWQPDDEFRGGWYQLGAWTLDFRAIKAALRRAIQEVEPEQRRSTYAAQGPVTGGDVDAAIALLHGDALLVEEVEGGSLYPNHRAAGPFYVNRNRVQAHWPKDCRTCGGSADHGPGSRRGSSVRGR